jgi:hypothetical protein
MGAATSRAQHPSSRDVILSPCEEFTTKKP